MSTRNNNEQIMTSAAAPRIPRYWALGLGSRPFGETGRAQITLTSNLSKRETDDQPNGYWTDLEVQIRIVILRGKRGLSLGGGRVEADGPFQGFAGDWSPKLYGEGRSRGRLDCGPEFEHQL